MKDIIIRSHQGPLHVVLQGTKVLGKFHTYEEAEKFVQGL